MVNYKRNVSDVALSATHRAKGGQRCLWKLSHQRGGDHYPDTGCLHRGIDGRRVAGRELRHLHYPTAVSLV